MDNNKVYCTYELIHLICKNNVDNIISDFNPDIILAIGGGGLIPGRILRSGLNKPIYVISLSSYNDETNINESKIIVSQWCDFTELKNKKILIVDEVDDTRGTLAFLVNKLKNEENITKDNLGVFVIHNKKKEKVCNDLDIKYYKSGIDIEDKWIVYPWE